jgi:hypothetical protein
MTDTEPTTEAMRLAEILADQGVLAASLVNGLTQQVTVDRTAAILDGQLSALLLREAQLTVDRTAAILDREGVVSREVFKMIADKLSDGMIINEGLRAEIAVLKQQT